MHNHINHIREAQGLLCDEAVDVEERVLDDGASPDDDDNDLLCYVCHSGDVSGGNDIVIREGNHSEQHGYHQKYLVPPLAFLAVHGSALNLWRMTPLRSGHAAPTLIIFLPYHALQHRGQPPPPPLIPTPIPARTPTLTTIVISNMQIFVCHWEAKVGRYIVAGRDWGSLCTETKVPPPKALGRARPQGTVKGPT